MTPEVITVIIYVVVLLYLGFRARQKHPDNESFFLSGRTLTLPAMVATLVTTWYGGILGVGEYVYRFGISAWTVFGLPYYLFAGLFALIAARKLRLAQYMGIPDLLYKNYGKKTGFIGSIYLLFITSPAPYILASGIILGYVFNLPLVPATLISAFFSIIYVAIGGFGSVVRTDKFQFILMYGGFIILSFFLLMKMGNPIKNFHKLPAYHLSLTGGMNWQQLLVWFLIASWTFIDPSFHQRVAAAQNSRTARNGILISIIFWLFFDIMTINAGLFAVNHLKNISPLLVYPILAQYVLPPILYSLFIVGLLAIAMSTVDSYTFLSAQTFGQDLVARLNQKNSDMEVQHYTRQGLLLTAIIALLLIWVAPSIVDLWYNLGSVFIPPLLLPILAVLFPRIQISPGATLFNLLFGFLISFIWLAINEVNGSALLGIQPFIPGMSFSLLLYFTVLFKNKIIAVLNNYRKRFLH